MLFGPFPLHARPKEIAMKLLSVKFATVALALLAMVAFPLFAAADQPLGTMELKSANLTLGEGGFATLHMTGTAEELGNCSCYGELDFVPGDEQHTLDGLGVVVFTAANGDQLVGVIAMQIDTVDGAFSATIHWRDDVTFRDGTTVASSGRFVEHRPPGIFVIRAKMNNVFPTIP
jgi:hypothetical protein